MLFEGLNWIKRNLIMTAILLMSFGIVLLILPVRFLPAMIEGIGAVMIVIAIEMVFEFLGSNKALIHYLFLTAAIAIGIGGMAVLIFQFEMIYVLGFFFGLLLIIEGIHAMLDGWVYARHSEKKRWWIIVPLAVAVIAFGVIICLNPWWKEAGVFKMVISGAIILSAVFTVLRLFWLWPVKTNKK